MQIFLQYCYSAILCLELHCSKYCKKVIIFYLTLSSLSLISRLWLSLSSVSHLSSLSLISVSPSPNPAPATQHHITPSATATRNPAPQRTAHEFAIYDPRSNTAKPTWRSTTHVCDPRPTIHNQSNASTSSSRSEWSFGFYWSRVVKFMIFCLWVLLIDAFLVDLWSFRCLSWWVIVGLFHHLIGNEGSDGSYRWERAENERNERDEREDIILRYIILLCRYIILMSKRVK